MSSLTFLDFYRELCGNIQEMPEPIAKRLVQRAHRAILDARSWSFLFDEGTYFTPALINTGTINVTQFSNDTLPNAAAVIALSGLSNPLITRRQIRFGSTSSPIYNVNSFDGTTLTLDRPYLESTNVANTYSLYRCFYTGPLVTTFDTSIPPVPTTDETTDFALLLAVWDTVNGFPIRPHFMAQQLSRTDPLRGSLDTPFRIYAYRVKPSTNEMIYEWWPHPTSENQYKCLFRRKGTVIGTVSGDDDTLTEPLTDNLLTQRAMIEAIKWAKINVKGRVSGGAFDSVLRDYRNDYAEEWSKVTMRDKELSRVNEFVMEWNGSGYGIMDSNWMQSHAPDPFGYM